MEGTKDILIAGLPAGTEVHFLKVRWRISRTVGAARGVFRPGNDVPFLKIAGMQCPGERTFQLKGGTAPCDLTFSTSEEGGQRARSNPRGEDYSPNKKLWPPPTRWKK